MFRGNDVSGWQTASRLKRPTRVSSHLPCRLNRLNKERDADLRVRASFYSISQVFDDDEHLGPQHE